LGPVVSLLANPVCWGELPGVGTFGTMAPKGVGVGAKREVFLGKPKFKSFGEPFKLKGKGINHEPG